MITRLLSPISGFLQLEAFGSLLLLFCLLVALGCANSPWAAAYQQLWDFPLALTVGSFHVSEPLRFWLNEGLMTLFFVVIGLEIKREVLIGELASVKKAALPVIAAWGGMLFPALFFLALNPPGTVASHGWGIPIATDIALAVGVLTLCGNRVPSALKVFLLALAIADDLGAILVIALFYSQALSGLYLGIGLGLTLALLLMNRQGVQALWPYCFVGILLWVAMLNTGIHATLAGVVFAFTIPTQPSGSAPLPVETSAQNASQQNRDPLLNLERILHPVVTFGVLPLFALANAGVSLGQESWRLLLSSPVTWGVIAGLVLGKPLGITLLTWASTRLGITALPDGVTLGQILAVGCLGGIGFTMSLFVAGLSFQSSAEMETAKVGILAASLLAGLLGWILLNKSCGPWDRSRG